MVYTLNLVSRYLKYITALILCFRLLAGEKDVYGTDGKYFVVRIPDLTVRVSAL